MKLEKLTKKQEAQMEVKYKDHTKAEKTVTICRDFLKSNGFIVSKVRDACANGYDLVGIKNGRGFTFEVKPAYLSAGAYKLDKVTVKNSDFVCVVMPSGQTLIYAMKEHLKLCAPNGSRCLTHVGLVFEESRAVID